MAKNYSEELLEKKKKLEDVLENEMTFLNHYQNELSLVKVKIEAIENSIDNINIELTKASQ